MIEIKNLRKKFPGTDAIDGITLDIPDGVVVGLAGLNGSGKTTLLKLIFGFLRPSYGKVLVDGEKPGFWTKSIVAYTPEVDTLYHWMGVREIIDWYASFFEDWNNTKEKALIKILSIEEWKKVGELSRGLRTRLKLLLSLSRDAKIFLLDEPLIGIDPSSREKIEKAILGSISGKEIVIFSTHIVKEVEKIFDKVIFLKKGEIAIYDDADSLRKKYGKGIEEIFKEVFND